MKRATLKQAKKVLELAEDLPAEHLQNLLESGLLSVLFYANVNEMMDRMTLNEFRKLCGLFEFPIWKTIKLGTGLKTADDFCEALKDNGFGISDWAKDILGKPAFTVAAKETEVDLVRVTVAELGFKKSARRDQIYARAKKLGLKLCPPEVGLQLRLQYQDQPNGECFLIGMEWVFDSDGSPRVFSVRRNDLGLCLGSYFSYPGGSGDFWNADDQWVFVRPRPHK